MPIPHDDLLANLWLMMANARKKNGNLDGAYWRVGLGMKEKFWSLGAPHWETGERLPPTARAAIEGDFRMTLPAFVDASIQGIELVIPTVIERWQQ